MRSGDRPDGGFGGRQDATGSRPGVWHGPGSCERLEPDVRHGAGIRAGWDRRLIAVFQPHLYSRTRDFYQEFGRSFLNSDIFICTDVYPAREEPIGGVSGKMITDAAKKFGHKNVLYVPDKKNIPMVLSELKKDNDIIITMGAGDIWRYGEEFVRMIKG